MHRAFTLFAMLFTMHHLHPLMFFQRHRSIHEAIAPSFICRQVHWRRRWPRELPSRVLCSVLDRFSRCFRCRV